MKKTLIAAAALVAMVACNKNLIESPVAQSNEFGFINLGVSADTEMVVTKGITTEADLTDYEITLKKDDAKVWTKTYAEVTEAGDAIWKVAAGNYSVLVENITTAEVYDGTHEKGQVRVSGESSVVVYPGISSSCTVECTPQNSKVSFLYTEKFAQVFQVSTAALNVTDEAKAFDMEMMQVAEELDKNSLDAAYYEPTVLTWTLNIKNMNGETGDDKSYSSTVTTKKATWTHVTFDTGDTTGTINVTITVNGEITTTETITAVLDPMDDKNVTIQ